MSHSSMEQFEHFIGLDVSDRHAYACILDTEGEILQEVRISLEEIHLRKFAAHWVGARLALEVGTHSPWVSRLLDECGLDVIVANARKLRLIYENDQKSDRVDAEYLARLVRIDPRLLFPITHRGKEAQADRAVLKSRDVLVRSRTKLINHVRSLVKSMGARLPRCDAYYFHARVRGAIPIELDEAVIPIINMIESLTTEIRQYDRKIDRKAKDHPVMSHLLQVPGVGSITATAFVLAIEDPHRFRKSRQVGTYFGLTPRRADSGQRHPQLHVTKAGDGHVRRLLVQAAQYILGPFGPDTALRRWGLAIAERGEKRGKKLAAVAVARRLAVTLHRMWVTGEIYERFPGGMPEEVVPLQSA